MVVQPGVEVNSVPDAATPKADGRDAQAVEEGDPDAEVVRGLLLREAADRGAWQNGIVHREVASDVDRA